MFSGQTPYSAAEGDIYQLYEQICQTRLTFPANILLSEEVRSFISALLFASPRMRLGCDAEGHRAVRKHSWFTSSNMKVRDGVQVSHAELGSFRWDQLNKMQMKSPHIPSTDPIDLIDGNTACHVAYDSLFSTLLPEAGPCEGGDLGLA